MIIAEKVQQPVKHELAELAPRDVVARAIWRRLEDGDRVVLDVRPLGNAVADRFPTVWSLCVAHGLDPARDDDDG